MERRGKSCKFSRNTHLNGEFRLKNREIAEILETIADLLEIKGDAVYRVIAYRRAGEALRSLGRRCQHCLGGGRSGGNPRRGNSAVRLGGSPLDREYMAAESAPGVIKIPRIDYSQPQPLDAFGVNHL